MNLETVQLHLVDDFSTAQDLMSWLGERRPVLACDTETGGLEWWRDALRMVQFGDAEQGWAVPWEEWAGLAKEVFRRYDGPLVFHNAPFDVRYLEQAKCSITRGRVHDTRVMAHLVDSSQRTGLKPCGVRYVNPALADLQDDLKADFARNMWTWATVPWDFGPYHTYAALDTVITANLYEKLRPLTRPYERSYELEIAAQWVLMDMVTRGCRIDLAYCKAKYGELTRYVEEMGEFIKNEYGSGLTPRLLADTLIRNGVELTERTPTGEWSTTAEVLSGIDHPLAADYLKRKQAQKIASAYFKNFLEKADGDLLHPDINPLAAVTGRMSISTPAVQQLPRGRIVRDAFIARQGNKLIDIDFSQIEQRLIAHFSGDSGLIEAFEDADINGGDFITNVARLVWQDDTIQKADARRQTAKNVMYARGYGAGPEKIALMAGITEDEARSFIDGYDRRFPGARQFLDQVERVAQRRLEDEGQAYIVTPWGRRIPGEDDRLYALTNYLIQGTAADVLKQKLVDLDNAGLAQYAVLPVHDEVLFDVPEADAEEIAREVVAVFEDHETFTVPLRSGGADIGDTWGEVH